MWVGRGNRSRGTFSRKWSRKRLKCKLKMAGQLLPQPGTCGAGESCCHSNALLAPLHHPEPPDRYTHFLSRREGQTLRDAASQSHAGTHVSTHPDTDTGQ